MPRSEKQEKISLQALAERLTEGPGTIACSGLPGAARAYLAARLYSLNPRPLVIIAPDAAQAEHFIEDLNVFLPAGAPPVWSFPSYNLLPFKQLAYHNRTAAERIATLYRLLNAERPPIFVTTAAAVLQKLIPRREIVAFAELVVAGEDLDRDQMVARLSSGGYQRTMIVEEPGEFCVRGGIVDVFSPLYIEPVRIEMFGDQVESLRFFSPLTQKRSAETGEVVLLPARESVLGPDRIEAVVQCVRRQAALIETPAAAVREAVERLRSEGTFPGLESLIPLIYPQLSTLFDYLPQSALFLLSEPQAVESAAHESWQQAEHNFEAAREAGRLCVSPPDLYLQWNETEGRLRSFSRLDLKLLAVGAPNFSEGAKPPGFHFTVEDNGPLSQDIQNRPGRDRLLQPLSAWIEAQLSDGCRTLLTCSTRSQAARLKSLLAPYGLRPPVLEPPLDWARRSGGAQILLARPSTGFAWPLEGLALVTEDEIFGAKHRRRRVRRRKGPAAQPVSFADLKQGDLVVHREHGIGRYEGLVKLTLDGSTNDFLLLRYRDDDRLYLPVDRMGLVQRYMGVEGIAPVLDKMGGRSWERVKGRVRKSVQIMAGKLLELYAARKVERGHAFSPNDGYFQDFEAGFSYEETPDQLQAIDDVLRDMERAQPMDRLVCGDVGYGKTEVALRAAFKAISDGKQVAVLVPTTVLAEQHYASFVERFRRYPVNVAGLSRFRSAAEQRRILSDLRSGTLDCVIGTHRLLQRDVAFKDLGLIVVDEEQRFGVRHKERLKQFRRTVDVLALTATPIPRTLHMSLVGVRDISIISTPPEHRQAIVTYVCGYDDQVAAEAIRKELQRGGQIFFVHNQIHSIESMAGRLKKLVPEVRLDVAHGQMGEDDLEQVMLRFVNREIDMLVCTTIIESGLDIPAANTILVNRADRFGLAQMYQLRGRVGRADVQAYAYLFVPEETLLSGSAQKRLKVLMDHSDIGAGFQIAMNDLRIRGGGSILGVSQSGHIAAVGYDMFLQLMEEAVQEQKGEPVRPALDPEINLSLSAFIPEAYIPDIDQRLSAYRRLARLRSSGEMVELKGELIDRYGPLPPEGANLLRKIVLKVLSVEAGVRRLDLAGQALTLHFSPEHQQYPAGIVALVDGAGGKYRLTPDLVLRSRLSRSDSQGLLLQTKKILKEISRHVNG